jgi:hypothetical protein
MPVDVVRGCHGLQSLLLSGWRHLHVAAIDRALTSCTQLAVLDVAGAVCRQMRI